MTTNKGGWALTTIMAVLFAAASAKAQSAQPGSVATDNTVDTPAGWNLQQLASQGLSSCYVTARKAGDVTGSPSTITNDGHGNFTVHAVEGVATEVDVVCKSAGKTSPSGFPIDIVDQSLKGWQFWYCPTGPSADQCLRSNGTRINTAAPVSSGGSNKVVWSDGSASDTINISWSLTPAHATVPQLGYVATTAWWHADDAAMKASKHTLLKRSFSLRLGYVRSLDTQGEPARSGFTLGAEGYLLGGDDSPVKLSLGAVLSRTEWKVPVLNAPNLQEPNSYVDGNKTYIGPTLGFNWTPGSGFVLNGRASVGFWIWENGTAPLSQTANGSVFISPASTDRPISGRLEGDVNYAIGDVVLVGLGIAVTRNFEEAQTFRGFDFPGYTIPTGCLTDVDGVIHLGYIW